MSTNNGVDIKELAHGHWSEILAAAGIPQTALVNVHGPCPLCGGTDRYRFDDRNGDGDYYCNKCGPGNGIKLYMGTTGDSFAEMAKWIRSYLGANPVQPKATVAQASQKLKQRPEEVRKKLEKTWKEAIEIRGSVAEAYLKGRGLSLQEWPASLRCHPSLPYYETDSKGETVLVGKFPTMLAAVQSAEGTIVTLHRTYLAEDGSGKAPVKDPKKTMSTIGAGAAVRLAKVRDRMAIAEGIENAIAVTMHLQIPCWSVLSAPVMRSFEPPACVSRLWIYGDNDAADEKGRRAGQDAANCLADRMKEKGISARIVLPTRSDVDFADIWRDKQ